MKDGFARISVVVTKTTQSSAPTSAGNSEPTMSMPNEEDVLETQKQEEEEEEIMVAA